MKTEISIIVPVYNSENTLKGCLQAIQEQLTSTMELIVVDDGSTDKSLAIAKQFASKLVTLKTNRGKFYARSKGVKRSKGEIIINIDSDVIIKTRQLAFISKYFKKHPEVSAITGLVSKSTPYCNFSSQYKNLYMHYYFTRLPREVSFLYGSIYAVRRTVLNTIQSPNLAKQADDTEMGQLIINKGVKIHLLKGLQIIHLKKYSLLSLIKNDFEIPADWSYIFWNLQGWRQLFRNKTGFAHASREQVVSIFIMIFTIFLTLLAFWDTKVLSLSFVLVLCIVSINREFLLFLSKEKDFVFFIKSLFWMLIDYIVMLIGILYGTVKASTNYGKRKVLLLVETEGIEPSSE